MDKLEKELIGFTCGAFDLLHTGHVLMLEECKRYCTKLIVGLQTNPTLDREEKNKPVQSMYERYVQLKAVKFVDEIIPYDDEHDLENLLYTLKFDIRFLDEKYCFHSYTGKAFCNTNKTIHYTSRLHDYSTTYLRARVNAQE